MEVVRRTVGANFRQIRLLGDGTMSRMSAEWTGAEVLLDGFLRGGVASGVSWFSVELCCLEMCCLEMVPARPQGP
jgi:hypothetical protein